jgi:hypothetical protein
LSGIHTQGLHVGQHRFALHRATVVGAYRDLVGADALTPADVLQQRGGPLCAFAIKDLPAHHLAAEDVHEQVQVEEQAAHLGGQAGDVPAVDLLGPCRHQCSGFAALFRHAFKAAVSQLSSLTQQPVQGWLARHMLALVSQAGHDLAGRQVLELLTAQHSQSQSQSQSRQAFRIAELLPSNQHLRCWRSKVSSSNFSRPTAQRSTASKSFDFMGEK